MKRILAIALSVIVTVAMLTACGPEPEILPPPAPGDPAAPADTPAPATVDPIDPGADDEILPPGEDEYVRDFTLSGTLKVWYDDDAQFEEIRARFNALYPNIELEYNRISHTESRGQLQLDGPAGLGADVFVLPHDHILAAIMDGLVEPLSQPLQNTLRRTQNSTAVAVVTHEGQMYAAPRAIENIALFYNKDLWGPNPPQSMEEILEFAAEYNNPAANQWAMKWQVADSYHNFHWFSAHGMQLFGDDHMDFTQPGWSTPEGIAGAAYVQMLRNELLDVEADDSNWDASVAEFQAGNLPLTISGPWAIADAVANGVNFGVTKLPTINGVQPVCFSGVRLVAMSSYTEVPELAEAFIDWFTSVEGATYLYEFEGQLPSYRDLASVPGLSDDANLMGIGEQSPYTIPMPIIREMQAFWEAHVNVIVFSWNRLLTPEEAGASGVENYMIQLQAMDIDVGGIDIR